MGTVYIGMHSEVYEKSVGAFASYREAAPGRSLMALLRMANRLYISCAFTFDAFHCGQIELMNERKKERKNVAR